MSPREDGQVATTSTTNLSVLPQRIEFHLSRKSSLSFSDSSFKPQNTSIVDASRPSHANSENGMDPDFKVQMIVRRIGAGLENLGNTCFLNSVLQCLTYTEPLVAYLQSGKHQNSCLVNGFCALCAIQKHATRALQSTGRTLAPKDLVSNLRRISRNFRNGRQEDAHEYMVHLLEAMHKCCLPSGVPSESPSSYDKSLVHKIFGGCLRSQVRCMQCSYCSNKFDPFLDLSLEIVKADSLQKALTHFTAREQLDGGERQYQCQQCKQKVRALKQLTIDKVPYVLTIHLKRFGSHVSGQKIDKKVQFGSTLNLKPFVSGSCEGDLNYTLYGVLVHAGWSTHSGHYYCFVRASSGMWYSLDDSRVVQVSEKTVLEQKAYMLFYVREGKIPAPENIASAIQMHKMFSTSMQNGSYNISATSQRLENRPTDKSSSAVLQNAVTTPAENGLQYTSATCQGFQNKSAGGSANSVQKDKARISSLQNGSCNVSQGFPKGSGNEGLEINLQDDISANNKCNGVDASDDIVHNNLPNAQLVNQSLSKDSSAWKCNSKHLSQSSFERKEKNSFLRSNIQRLVCLGGSTGVHTSTPSDRATTMQSSNSLASEEKGSVTVEIVPRSCYEVGSALKESDSEQSPDTSSSLGKSNGGLLSADGLPSNAFNISSRQKLKKKVLKYKVASMHLSTRMLYGASLRLQRRKKPKKFKRHSKQFDAMSIADEEMGPSTSHVTSSIIFHASRSSVRKGSSSGIRKTGADDAKSKAISSGVSVAENCPSELKKRTASGVTVHAGEDQVPVTLKQQQDGLSSHLDSKTMVTNSIADNPKNFKVTAVMCWDDMELDSSQTVDVRSTDGANIGYVPDEWDEEYDRGKRKKFRTSKISFGGPNPFQEIATKAAKSEAKRKGYNVADQPFRI